MTQPLHIAIDASRTTTARLTGTEHYARQLIHHLIALNDEQAQPHRLTLYFRDTPPPNLFPASAHVQQRVIPLVRAWTHVRFAAAIAQDKPDVTFVPAHTLPVAFWGRAVVTVHDLGYRYFPQAHPRHHRLYLDATTAYSAHRAALVLADSHATAHDLTHFYGTSPDKIRVVYPGVEAPPPDFMRYVAGIRQKYHLPFRYFVFIGTLQPRKNIARLVQAFDIWQDAHQDGTGLVLAGAQGWLYDEAWVAGINNVHCIGYIADADKAPLLGGAEALIFPSLYEGFGFPVLEAMHCGTPVIASNTSSLPELVGDAGLLVDPLSVHDIAAAMDVLTWKRPLRRILTDKGLVQAQKFNWRRSAHQTLLALEEAAGKR